jgi:hypothetical protein
LATLAVGLILLLRASSVTADDYPHEQNFGRYVIRAKVIQADALPRATLERHRLTFEGNHDLLEVLVLKGGARALLETAPVTVVASMREAGGAELPIDMHPIVVNGRLSWVGTSPESAPGKPLDFSVTAFAEDDTAFEMEFSDRPERAVQR